MKKLKSHSVYILLTLVTLLLLFFFYHIYLLHPNAYLLSTGGDAFKNYFTPSWYVKYDRGLHFSGMNYPYGDHVVFTDNQPIISFIIHFIDIHIYPVSNNVVGILNICMFASIVICVLLVYKILRHYYLPPWYAFFAALSIGFMSPQMERITAGHFALTYCFFIPFIWWQCIKLKQNAYALKTSIWTIVCISFFSFVHMYYVLIAFLFFASYACVLFIKRQASRKKIASLLSIACIPLAVIFLFMRFTDHVHDRPQSPYGFFSYTASFQSVFLPRFKEVFSWWITDWKLPAPNEEGYAYVGIAGFMLLILSVFYFSYRLAKKKSIKKALLVLPGDLHIYLAAATGILLFSMALPFSLGLDFLLDWISPLKQFRSLGRFAWIFYYVFLIYGAVVFYIIFRKIKIKRNSIAYVFIISIVGLTLWESMRYNYFKTITLSHTRGENSFLNSNIYYSDVLKYANYSPDTFQAILYIPFFLQGSEKLYIDRSMGGSATAMQIAYQTGLPLIDCMMSRTSLSQTLALASLVNNPVLKKDFSFLSNTKPLLLISGGAALTAGENDLIAHAKKIGERSGLTFYELPTTTCLSEQDSLQQYFNLHKNLLLYSEKEHYYSDAPIEIFYKNDFDSLVSPEPLFGSGSLYIEHGQAAIAEIPVAITDTIWIEVSYWAKSYVETTAYPYISVQFVDANNKTLHSFSVSAKLSTDIYKDWVRGAENYEVTPDVKKIKLCTSNSKKINFDNVLVRHTAYNVFYDLSSSGSFMFNNYPVGK